LTLKGIEDLSLAYGLNHYAIDKPLRDVLKVYLGSEPDLRTLGELAGRELYEVAYRVDRLSEPLLITWSVRGDRVDSVWLDPAERLILEKLIWDIGVNRYPFNGGSWHEHYASLNIIGDPGVSCILTITIQTAYTLEKYALEPVRSYYRSLSGLSKPIMFGATWFTEIQGGSDLGANATVARESNGLWRLNGYKYFASGAGLADVALVTARTPGSPPGAKGLSLFAVPRVRGDGSLNFYVRRLKAKSGTIAVPTGEVELVDSEGYLVGEAGKGIYYALESLMVSRLANSHGALGIARKAYLEAALYTLHRRAFGRRLVEHRLVRRDLLEAESLIEAGLVLAHEATEMFQRSSRDTPPYTPAYHYARLLTHIAKNVTAEIALRVTTTSMELLGGLGFLTEYPVERWHREALITPIWEGTSNIQALDMLEVMAKKGAHKTLLEEMRGRARETMNVETSRKALTVIETTIEEMLVRQPEVVEYEAKDLLRKLGYAISIILLENVAARLWEKRYHVIAETILERELLGRPIPLLNDEDFVDVVSLGGQINI
jgi:acyl-CoA dehydrogenase